MTGVPYSGAVLWHPMRVGGTTKPGTAWLLSRKMYDSRIAFTMSVYAHRAGRDAALVLDGRVKVGFQIRARLKQLTQKWTCPTDHPIDGRLR